MTRPLPAVAAALALAACQVPEEGPMMDPGEDCLACHGGGGDAPAWTLAGTVYSSEDTADPGAGVRGATVTVLAANGKRFELRSNEAGNFYTAEKLVFPVRVAVNGHEMEDPLQAGQGGCNACHRPGGEAGRVPAS